MAYVSTTYTTFKGQLVADAWGGYLGQCVSYVKRSCQGLGGTKTWKKGVKVKGDSSIKEGTAISVFDIHGKYGGHAAIYVKQTEAGLQVWDQWNNDKGEHPVAPRSISFRNGTGPVVDDGDRYWVID